MKKFILLLIVAPGLCIGQHFNPYTGTMDENDVADIHNNNPVPSASPGVNLSGIPCNPGSFWSTDLMGNMVEYNLAGNTITFSNNILLSTGYLSLACANNLSGSSFSPTFYSHASNVHDVIYFDGLSWITSGSVLGYNIYNCGGSANNLYYQGIPDSVSGFLNKIIKFDGINFNDIYTTSPGRFLAPADLAVDLMGNVYFFTCSNFPLVDSLMVISPAGTVIKQFPFALNAGNAYGSFIMNGTFYIGLGSGNPSYPNTLLPVTFSAVSAIQGTPIPFPTSANYLDLESCNQGLPLAVNNSLINESSLTISNPSSGICYIYSGSDKITSVIIYDMNGREIKAFQYNQKSVEVKVSDLADGLYILKVSLKKVVLNKKVEVRKN